MSTRSLRSKKKALRGAHVWPSVRPWPSISCHTVRWIFIKSAEEFFTSSSAASVSIVKICSVTVTLYWTAWISSWTSYSICLNSLWGPQIASFANTCKVTPTRVPWNSATFWKYRKHCYSAYTVCHLQMSDCVCSESDACRTSLNTKFVSECLLNSAPTLQRYNTAVLELHDALWDHEDSEVIK